MIANTFGLVNDDPHRAYWESFRALADQKASI